MARTRRGQQALAAEMIGSGLTDDAIADAVGVTRRTINRWKNSGFPSLSTEDADPTRYRGWRPRDRESYGYLLGLYLGDGIVRRHTKGTYSLRITLDDRYPGIVEACVAAMESTAPARVGRYQRRNDHGVNLTAYSGIWPYAFPQHGPGRKHTRQIALQPWQGEIVVADPRPLLRGLIHSDGCRCVNRFSVGLKDGPREYEYPRYFFTNYSADILGIFCRYCDQLRVKWSRSSFKNISVSHRKSVAILDSFIGPKC